MTFFSFILPGRAHKPLTTTALCAIALFFGGCCCDTETNTDAGTDAASDTSTTDGAAADSGADAGMDAICARTSMEMQGAHAVAVCEEAFDAPPYVRLPADETEGTDRFIYGGIADHDGNIAFVGRGVTVPISDVTSEWLTGEMGPPVRYGYHLYRARVQDDAVQELTPVARIDDRVFQRMLAGQTLEGAASRRSVVEGEVRFDFETVDVPIRVQLAAAPIDEVADAETTGFARYTLMGTIENATASVMGSDGECIGALADLGEESPIFGGEGDQVQLHRHPNMHGGFDDVFTWDWPAGVFAGNNMGGGLFISTAALIQSAAPVFAQGDSSPHGVPWGGPSTRLQIVDGGGTPCAAR